MDIQEELKALKQWSKVKTWRDRGIQACWMKMSGRPVMTIRPTFHGVQESTMPKFVGADEVEYFLLGKKDYNRIEQFIMEGKTLQEAAVLHYSLKNRQM